MEEKKAFVFDTNFIVQKNDLTEVIANLSDRFTVYITQVSVEERIAQQCRDLKFRYDEVEKIKEKYKDITRITIVKPYSDAEKYYRAVIQKKYEDAFQDRLIPFQRDGAMLSAVFDRANKKTPPFSSDANASDKGFKDALIWESVLAFFKEHGEQEVLFITDDAGFIKNAGALCSEFNAVTNKSITIHPNTYYRELLKPELVENPKPRIQIPSVEQLRERVQTAIFNICFIETTGYWGDEEIEKTFTTSKLVDSDYVQTVFENLGTVLLSHLLETDLPASVVLDLDNRITDTNYQVPISALENAGRLYNDMLEQYPDYLVQFFSAAATIINQNYKEPAVTQNLYEEVDDDELPF